MKTDFHNKDFALSLALKWRLTWTRKWPIERSTSGHGARASKPNDATRDFGPEVAFGTKFPIPVARQWGREMSAPRPFETDPFHPLGSICNIKQLQYTATSKNVVLENDECQLSNGDCTTEKKCGYWILVGNKLPWCRLHTVPTFDGGLSC